MFANLGPQQNFRLGHSLTEAISAMLIQVCSHPTARRNQPVADAPAPSSRPASVPPACHRSMPPPSPHPALHVPSTVAWFGSFLPLLTAVAISNLPRARVKSPQHKDPTPWLVLHADWRTNVGMTILFVREMSFPPPPLLFCFMRVTLHLCLR